MALRQQSANVENENDNNELESDGEDDDEDLWIFEMLDFVVCFLCILFTVSLVSRTSGYIRKKYVITDQVMFATQHTYMIASMM